MTRNLYRRMEDLEADLIPPAKEKRVIVMQYVQPDGHVVGTEEFVVETEGRRSYLNASRGSTLPARRSGAQTTVFILPRLRKTCFLSSRGMESLLLS